MRSTERMFSSRGVGRLCPSVVIDLVRDSPPDRFRPSAGRHGELSEIARLRIEVPHAGTSRSLSSLTFRSPCIPSAAWRCQQRPMWYTIAGYVYCCRTTRSGWMAAHEAENPAGEGIRGLDPSNEPHADWAGVAVSLGTFIVTAFWDCCCIITLRSDIAELISPLKPRAPPLRESSRLCLIYPLARVQTTPRVE